MISDLDLEQELKLLFLKLDCSYQYLFSLIQTQKWQAFHHHLLNLANICVNLRSRQTIIYSTMAESIAFLINHNFSKLVPERIQLAPLIPIFHLLKKDVHFTPKYQWLHQRFSDIVQFYQYLNFEEQFEDIDDKNKKLRDDLLKNSLEALYSETPNKESYAYKCLQVMTQDQKNIFEIIAVNTYFKFSPKGQDQSKKDIIFDKFISTSNPLVLLQLLNLQSKRMEQIRESICELKLVKKEDKWELQGQCKVEKAYITSEILFKALKGSHLMYHHLAQNFLVSTQKQIIFKYQISRILHQGNFTNEDFFNTHTKIKRETDYSQVKTDFQSIITSSFAIIEGILSGKAMWAFSNNHLIEVSQDQAIILALKMKTYVFRTKFTFEFDLQHSWDDKPTINFEINQDQLREAFSKVIQYCINSVYKINDAIINGIIEVIRWFQESQEHKSIIQQVFSKQGEKEIHTSFLSLILKYMSQMKIDQQLPYNIGIWMIKSMKKELLGDNNPVSSSIYSLIYTFLIENHRYHSIVSLELDQINYESSYKVNYYKMVQQFLDNNPDFITIVIDKWMKELDYFETDDRYFRKDRKCRLALHVILFNHKSFPLNEDIKPKLKRLLGMEDMEDMRPKQQYKYIWQAFLKKIEFDLSSEFDFAISQLLRHTQDTQILARNYKAVSYRLTKPQCLRDLNKIISRLYFILGTTQPIPNESQVIQLLEIMLNFTQIQSNYHQILEEASQEYSEAELQWLQALSNHSFGGFPDDLFQKFSRIKSFLTEKVSNLVVNHRVIIRLGAHINALIEKIDNVRLIHVTLNTISRFLRDKSSKLQCELFPQLYSHYKETIITLLQTLFERHSLTFQCEEEPSSKENQAEFALQLLKEGKNVKQGWQKHNKELLQYSIKRLVGEIFSNENWQYSVLLNNIKYEKTNNLKLFEKTIQEDLTTRIVASFHPGKISFYQKLFKMIDDCYHRRSRDDLQCSQIPLAIQPPAQPLVLITKIADLEKFYRTYEKFILKLFEHWQAFDSSESFQKLYKILLSELQDEANAKLQKQILNQLIKGLFGILTENPLSWNRYQKMHTYINTVVDSFNDPIGSLLSQEFVEAYFARLAQGLSKNLFTPQNTKPFVQFVERLVPDSKPDVFDAQFAEYTKHSLQACIKLVKLVKVQEVESTVVSLMVKIIRMREACFDDALINLFKSVQGINETFSQLFCELAEKQLRQASIEQEIKSLFFRLHLQNMGKDENSRQKVKISQFAQIFSTKYKPHKKQMIQMAQRLTHKMTVKEEARITKYLLYNQDQKFEHSIYIGKDFIQNRPSEQLRTILSSFIKEIQVTNGDKFGKQLKQLRVISFSYPILTAYILMHPKQHGESTLPFIDYLLDAFCNNNIDEDSYGIFAYFSLDVGLIFTHNNKSIYFSQYLCHRMLSRLMEGELNNRKLLMIYFLAKTRKFADMCFIKMKEDKSMCDLLWEKLSSFRQGETYSNHLNVLIYGILILLYRENNVEGLNLYCEYWKNDDWEDYNSIINVNWLPFKHLRVKDTTKDDEVFKVNKRYQIQNKELYEYFETKYPQWYDGVEIKQQQQIKENPTTTQPQQEHKQQQKQPEKSEQPIQPLPVPHVNVKVSSEWLKHLGSLAQTHASDYRDIQSTISTNYFNQHRSAFQIFHIYFLEHPNDNTMQRKRRRNKDASYIFFDQLQEDSNQPSQSSENEQREEEFNANQQSPFAPEEFVRVRQPQQQEDAKSEDFQKELQAKITEITGEYTIQDQIIEEHIEQYTSEMMDLFNIINQRMTQLQRPLLLLSDIQGKNQHEKLQFLQGRQLQSDFDVKQATMTIQQFQSYCLGNVNKLQRLGSERRNVVRFMEDAMLMRFVQKSISSDSVDYIIDTIDENYQLLSNVLPHRMSATGQEALPNKPKSDEDIRYIKSANIPAENFEDISEQRLYELLLIALYYPCGLISTKNFPPFFENKRVQSKLVNTLLYIYKNPFQNPHFPKKCHHLDLQNLKWQEENNQETATNEIRDRITDIFMSGKTSAFYQDSTYLSEEIDVRGIKGIIYEPTNKSEQGSEKYKPINQVLELILAAEIKKLTDDQQQHECGYVFSLFNDMSDLLQSQLQKLLSFLKQVHNNIKKRLSNQSETADYDDIYRIMNQEKTYNITTNFKALLENQKIRDALRSAFPLDSQETDPFFVLLFMNSNVYPREQLLKLHRKVIQKDVANSSNVYFSNILFKLYTEEQLRECSWVQKSQNIMPCIIKALPKRNIKLKEQPFYRLCAYPDYLVLACKSEILYRKVKEYQQDLSFSGSDEVVAQRKKGIFQSAFLDLRNKPDGFWYQGFTVKFMNQAGKLESGYGRGVAKDWYAYVTKGMANLNYGIFMKTGKNYYFFNRQSWINPRHLQFLQFIGKLFALAIVNREFYLAPSFSILIYKMILGEKIDISDIAKQFDQGQVIRNIQKLRQYHDDSLFCQSFVYEDKRLISNRNLEILRRKRSMEAAETNMKEGTLYLLQEAVELKEETQQTPTQKEEIPLQQEQAPKMIKVLKIGESLQLIPGGAQIAVNKDNLQQFITLTKQKIYDIIVNGVQQQFNAFMAGFRRVVKPDFIKNISAQELREIAQGCDKISVDDLKKCVTVGRGVDEKSIAWFWECIQGLSARDRMYLIQHWTGLPKVSAQGFKNTNLNIVRGNYQGRLFAQTCFNKLHMPAFETKEKLEESVRIVINSVKLGESIIED